MSECDTSWAVDKSFTDSTFIPHTLGESYRILWYPDGSAGFEHRCKMIDDDTRLICAPKLMLGQGHEVLSRDPLHIEASILCPDCGTHGWVRDGRWIDAATSGDTTGGRLVPQQEQELCEHGNRGPHVVPCPGPCRCVGHSHKMSPAQSGAQCVVCFACPPPRVPVADEGEAR